MKIDKNISGLPDGIDFGRVLKAGALAVVSVAVRAFTQPDLRALPWARRKKDAAHPILMQNRVLRQSVRVLGEPSNNTIEVGSDRPYARVHQLGYKKRNVPARPFFPFLKIGRGFDLSIKGRARFEQALKAALDSQIKK